MDNNVRIGDLVTKKYLDDKLDILKFDNDNKFKAVDERFKSIDERFDQIDKRFAQIDERFDRLEAKMDRQFGIIEQLLKAVINSHGYRLHRLEEKVGVT